MFRVWLVNFGWYSEAVCDTVEEAKEECRRLAWECRIDYCDKGFEDEVVPLCIYTPLKGFRKVQYADVF